MFKKSFFLFSLAALFFASTLAFAETITVHVQGVVCAFCAQGIQKQFKAINAVKTVNVNLDEKTVLVELIPDGTLTDEAIQKLIQDAGYNVTGIERKK